MWLATACAPTHTLRIVGPVKIGTAQRVDKPRRSRRYAPQVTLPHALMVAYRSTTGICRAAITTCHVAKPAENASLV